jgi:hypothetical protein
MPYIKQEDRNVFDPSIQNLVDALDIHTTNTSTCYNGTTTYKFKGNLNYAFTKIAKDFMKNVELNGVKFGYQEISDIEGALRGAADEFKRRVLDPYEDLKITENGDV